MLPHKTLKKWLSQYYPTPIRLTFAASDAEFRTYFRLFTNDKTYVVMDALPSKMSILPFLKVHQIFHNLNVPHIFHFDIKKGFMVLEDMGTATYLQACLAKPDPNFHEALLMQAVDELIILQKATKQGLLKRYDASLFEKEATRFVSWFCCHELQHTLSLDQQAIWHNFLSGLLPSLTQQSTVFVHRDYMVRNLMVGSSRPGVLDFQDALLGPITYDLVSLLKDAFIEWDEALITKIMLAYWKKAQQAKLPLPKNMALFCEDFDKMSLQRHLKVIGIFARLAYRDQKPQYLPEIKRFITYLHRTLSRYPEFFCFQELLHELTDQYMHSKTHFGH